ncbi:MAG: peptidoglycan-associated lipoprotein Pal [Alphaproteobacteria bacterium]
MRFDSQSLVRISLIALTATTLAACATKKAPPPTAVVAQPPYEPPAPIQSQPQPRGPVTQTPQANLPPPARSPVAQPPGVGPGSIQDFVINVGERVYFDYDAYAIRADARPILDAQASWLTRYPAVNVRIEGNADERGTQEYNFALGERRANAVRDYLVSKGVAASRISVVSYGKERPIDPGSNEEAWQRNRNGHTAIVSGTR